MPSIQQHRAKAQENEQFAEWLAQSGSQHTDWMVTVLFYSALHHMETLLRYLGIPEADSNRHRKRRDLLKTDPRLYGEHRLRDDYFQLQDDSENARYNCYRLALGHVTQLRDEQVARIKAKVAQLTP